jgi:LuxR family maltose regulon positive regulatory protein
VTGQQGGRTTLEALDRGNLFLVPLDDRRHWYRYHHLFADVLQARLLDEQPQDLADLHRRASDWYEQNGDRPRRSAMRWPASSTTGPRSWSKLAIPVLRQGRQDATLRHWLEALPDRWSGTDRC